MQYSLRPEFNLSFKSTGRTFYGAQTRIKNGVRENRVIFIQGAIFQAYLSYCLLYPNFCGNSSPCLWRPRETQPYFLTDKKYDTDSLHLFYL